MDFVVLQILTALGVFLSLISFSYLPYCIIQYRHRKRSNAGRRKSASNVPVLSLCNCFAAGVFLATCFLGMVPHVREHVAQWNHGQQRREDEKSTENHSIAPSATTPHHKQHSTSNGRSDHQQHGPPWTEILLVTGFLMILLMEELINLCQRHCSFCHRRRNATDRNRPRRVTLSEDEPLMSDGELGSIPRLNGGVDGKPRLESPRGSLRMNDMDGHVHGRGSKANGHDHNHDHHHHIDASLLLGEGNRSLSWRSVALLLGLGVHGVFEGVALGLQDSSDALFALLIGVMAHEALCAIAFGINLAGNRASAGVAFLTAVLFSLSIPFGMVAGFVVRSRKSETGSGEMIRIALEGLAAGTFIYVAFMDMLAHELATGGHSHGHGHGGDGEGQENSRWRLAKVLCVCAGFSIFLGLTFVA